MLGPCGANCSMARRPTPWDGIQPAPSCARTCPRTCRNLRRNLPRMRAPLARCVAPTTKSNRYRKPSESDRRLQLVRFCWRAHACANMSKHGAFYATLFLHMFYESGPAEVSLCPFWAQDGSHSLLQASALVVNELLNAAGKLAAKTFDIIVGINVGASCAQTCSERRRSLLPTPRWQ